jgi:hypothetical protein
MLPRFGGEGTSGGWTEVIYRTALQLRWLVAAWFPPSPPVDLGHGWRRQILSGTPSVADRGTIVGGERRQVVDLGHGW